MDWITDPQAWIALATLTVLEIVLGIDNVVFISILADRLPPDQRNVARQLGLALAMLTRIGLLFSIVWLMGLTAPLFAVGPKAFSGRDLIVMVGGMFLLWKSTREIHERLEGPDHIGGGRKSRGPTLVSVVIQIALLDIVFSLDSVITAVGMADEVGVMVTAVVLAVGIMMLTARRIGEFVSRHPTIKMLALSFLLLIGMALIAEGFGQEIPKGYIYFAMGFSLFVEVLNLRAKKKMAPVQLHSTSLEPEHAPPPANKTPPPSV
jgi:predicted tellurium resistance membrane protein TerC